MRRILLLALVSLFSSLAFATNTSAISFFKNKYGTEHISQEKIIQLVQSHFDVNQYRNVKVQVIYNNKKQVDHLLVFLFSKEYHTFTLTRVNVDYQYNVLSMEKEYRLTKEDRDQQPGVSLKDVKCPNNATRFIAFAPNNMQLEQEVTIDVANAAKKHLLKTVSLLKEKATRENYLNYMSCPKLVGNFYDGDSDPNEFITVDGVITADDMKELLAGKFRYKVTNIWLACQAFKDPMGSAVIDTVQAQKYAAGLNNLLVGPSDYAGACAMKAAMNHLPMKLSFDICYKMYDDPRDIWGYGGYGSNYFGV